MNELSIIGSLFTPRCPVNGKMRAVLVDWLVEVHSQFKLLQETLYMTVYVIDKFLQVRYLPRIVASVTENLLFLSLRAKASPFVERNCSWSG